MELYRGSLYFVSRVKLRIQVQVIQTSWQMKGFSTENKHPGRDTTVSKNRHLHAVFKVLAEIYAHTMISISSIQETLKFLE